MELFHRSEIISDSELKIKIWSTFEIIEKLHLLFFSETTRKYTLSLLNEKFKDTLEQLQINAALRLASTVIRTSKEKFYVKNLA